MTNPTEPSDKGKPTWAKGVKALRLKLPEADLAQEAAEQIKLVFRGTPVCSDTRTFWAKITQIISDALQRQGCGGCAGLREAAQQTLSCFDCDEANRFSLPVEKIRTRDGATIHGIGKLELDKALLQLREALSHPCQQVPVSAERCTQCGLTLAEDAHEFGFRDHAFKYPEQVPVDGSEWYPVLQTGIGCNGICLGYIVGETSDARDIIIAAHNAALRQQVPAWICSSDRPPTEKDADKFGRVIFQTEAKETFVSDWRDFEIMRWPHWMAIPSLRQQVPAVKAVCHFKPCPHCGKGKIFPDTLYCALCDKIVYYDKITAPERQT